MVSKRVPAASLLVFMMFALAAVAFAQNTASIQGTATDPAGAVIVGAKVTVRGPLGIERTTLTNSIGYYEVPAGPGLGIEVNENVLRKYTVAA